MNPGELNCRITLERLSKLSDDSGGWAESYLPYAKAWAKISLKKAGQKEFAEQIIPDAVYEITIRYRQDLQTQDRVSYKGRGFRQIAPAFNVAEKNAYLKLTVEEVIEDD